MKTAVEWLVDQLKSQGFLYDLDIEVAIEEEKEQIIKAHQEGWSDAYDYLESDSNDQARQAEDYYEETYNQKIPPCSGHVFETE